VPASFTWTAGLAGALALVHGLLFVFDRRAAEHGFMAVFSGFLTLDVFADMMTNLAADYDAQLLWFRLAAVEPFANGREFSDDITLVVMQAPTDVERPRTWRPRMTSHRPI
jgi:hypothetical protein